MGEAPPQEQEYILVLLPFPHDEKVTSLIDSIRRKHHHVEIEYHNIAFTGMAAPDLTSVPEGMEYSRMLTHSCSQAFPRFMEEVDDPRDIQFSPTLTQNHSEPQTAAPLQCRSKPHLPNTHLERY